MGRWYDQLGLEERCEIARLQDSGASIRQIAAAVGRQPSTISRELRRNTGSGPLNPIASTCNEAHARSGSTPELTPSHHAVIVAVNVGTSSSLSR